MVSQVDCPHVLSSQANLVGGASGTTEDQASQGSLHLDVFLFGSQEVQVLLLLSLVLLALTQLSFGGLNVSVVYRAVLVGEILNFIKEG